jgi:hypothetical protein
MARQARREARQGAFRPGPLLFTVFGRRASWSLHGALALYAVAWAVERPGGDREPLGGAPVEEGATPAPP